MYVLALLVALFAFTYITYNKNKRLKKGTIFNQVKIPNNELREFGRELSDTMHKLGVRDDEYFKKIIIDIYNIEDEKELCDCVKMLHRFLSNFLKKNTDIRRLGLNEINRLVILLYDFNKMLKSHVVTCKQYDQRSGDSFYLYTQDLACIARKLRIIRDKKLNYQRNYRRRMRIRKQKILKL